MSLLYSADGCSKLPFKGHTVGTNGHCIAEQCERLLENTIGTSGNVIAGVVMTHSYRYAEFVSAGMGTKFIHEEKVVHDGSAVLDCHAEILARRGLNRYLLLQMKAAQRKKKSIFRVDKNQFVLDSHVKFHLYVSKVPCGDATKPIKRHEEAPLRYQEFGRCRPVPEFQENGWYKMSCSDKIALWNVVGVQGALLYQLLKDSVYFSTIIMDADQKDNCEERAKRAFFSRLGALARNKPDIKVINPSHRPVVNKKIYKAYCWVASDGAVEVLDSRTGRKLEGTTDVSKKALFELWCDIKYSDAPPDKTYHACKQEARRYQSLKKRFYGYFKETFGSEKFEKQKELDCFILRPLNTVLLNRERVPGIIVCI